MMQKKWIMLLLLFHLLLFTLSGCSAFDADGYVKALLDNSYKGESKALAQISKSSEEDMNTIYQESVQKTCAALLSDAVLSDTLNSSYQNFVKDMLQQADYQVSSASKNEDDSYTVTVLTRPLQLLVNGELEAQTASYIESLQSQVNEQQLALDESTLQEQTYEIMLQCYVDALANATYGETAEHTVHVTLLGNTYQADEDDLSAIADTLFSIQ